MTQPEVEGSGVAVQREEEVLAPRSTQEAGELWGGLREGARLSTVM